MLIRSENGARAFGATKRMLRLKRVDSGAGWTWPVITPALAEVCAAGI